MDTFGSRLAKIRKERDIKQNELADLLGITPSRLNFWEKDKREPDIGMIKKISQVLNVNADFLIGNDYEEDDLIIEINKLNSTGKIRLKEYVDFLLHSPQYTEKAEIDISPETEMVNIAKAAHNQQPLLLDEEGLREFAKKANDAPNSTHNKEMF